MKSARSWLDRFGLLGLAVAVAAAGCASTKRSFYIDDTANFSAVEAVAVLPFENFTTDAHAPEKLAQILYIELLRSKTFRLAEPGDVQRAMGELQIAPASTITPEQAAKLGERLAVQALFLGTVQELSVDRSSGVAAPTVSLHFEMVDTATGRKLWTSVVSRQGAGTSARLFGVGGTGTNEALHDLVRSALATVIE